MVARGRQRGAPGERNRHARLTAAQVAAIRRTFDWLVEDDPRFAR